MNKLMVLIVIIASLVVAGAGSPGQEAKQLEEAQQEELAAWRQNVEQAQSEFNKAREELEELPQFRRYQLAEARLNAAANGLAAVIKGTCGEAGIKPSECEISADGKTARRKERQR